MNNKGFTSIELVVSLAIIGILFFFLFGSLFIRFNTTQGGEHSGYVTAIEQKGIIFNNYRIYFKTDNSSSQEDVYCVQESDHELAKELREANKTRKQVTIHYEGVRGIGLGLCEGEKIVEIVN